MAENGHITGGFRAFLPYALVVLGAAIGMFYVRYGTQAGNPLIGVAIGAVVGRLVAVLVTRFAERDS
ncbi:MAG: hypothetical protein ACK5JR_07005 [Tropicimonas sp.]|uniref:hypothetical protein n=1 Tax=Tropicimonas sp. TaxID=2067044 RepID=UPI003A8B39B9